jgi:hypothetical protein
MRKLLALLILVLLAAPLAAASVNEFLQPYLLPGENPRLESFQTPGGSFELVRISGKPSFLLRVQDDSYSFIAADAEILPVLRAKTVAEMQLSETLESSLSLFSQFNDSRAAGEDECARQTGTDRFPCTDKDSCIVACRSVPNCGTALSYSIDSINAIRDWVALVPILDSAVASEMDAYGTAGEQLDSSFDPAPLDALIASQSQTTARAADATSNLLFVCSGQGKCFCKSTANMTALDSAGKLLLRARSNFTQLALLPNMSAQIASATAQRTSIKSQGELYALVIETSNARLADLHTQVDNSLIFIRDDGLITGVNELRAALVAIQQAVDAKNYTTAAQATEKFNTRLDQLSTQAAANVEDYNLIIGLQLNETQTIDQLSRMQLDDADRDEFLTLRARLDGAQFDTPIMRARADELKAGLTKLSKDSRAMLARAEKAQLNADIERLRESIANLTRLANHYDQKTTLGSASLELDDAKNALAAGDFETAAPLVADAEAQVAAQGKSLNAQVAQIKAASIDVSGAVLAIDEASKIHFTILQPDLTAANAELDSARENLNSNPQQAAQSGAKATQLAHDAVEKARANDQLATTGAMVLGAVLLVAVLYWLYRREEM